MRVGGSSCEGHIDGNELSLRQDKPMDNCSEYVRVPLANDVAPCIDPVQECGPSAREVHLRKSTVVPSETVDGHRVSVVVDNVPNTHDGAGFVDTNCKGVAGSREIECRQHPFAKQESMLAADIVKVGSNNVAAIVDFPSFAVIRA